MELESASGLQTGQVHVHRVRRCHVRASKQDGHAALCCAVPYSGSWARSCAAPLVCHNLLFVYSPPAGASSELQAGPPCSSSLVHMRWCDTYADADGWVWLPWPQFVDDIIARLLAFKPEISQLLDSLEERVYFTKRKARSKLTDAASSRLACVVHLPCTPA